jgi:hypothetical protein
LACISLALCGIIRILRFLEKLEIIKEINT